MSKIFTINKDFGVNYLASIQRIENIVPIPNADKLVKTTISGYDMIISKDMKVGDLVVYFPCESCICEKFLSANNLYDRSNFELNSNAEDVKKLIEQAEKQEGDAQQETLNKIRSMCGFFNNKNRVRILKLRGEYSQGFIAGVSSIVNAFPALADVDFEKMVGEQFNEINGEKFCWKYVPVTKEHQHGSQSHWKKRMKSLNKFDRIIPGTFVFHYDTTMLAEHIRELSPDDVVTISVKVHGCVERNTIVDTKERGKITIGEIVDNKLNLHIKAHDIDSNEDCYVNIDDFYLLKNDGEWYEIELEDGRKITITGNNPVWIPELNCYRRVDELTCNEKLLVSD